MIDKISIKKFEFCYFFYMVILMAYMAKETRVLPGGLSQPIAWSIPFIWTIVIIYRNRVSFNNSRFQMIILICTIWSLVQIVYREDYNLRQLGLYFSFIYTIVISYVHVAVYRRKLFVLFEHCMVIMCKIAIPLWVISNVFPTISSNIAHLFPSTGFGRNILWLYCWMNPYSSQVQGFLTRNAGCSWEPGRFAVMLSLAIAVNLLYNGIRWKGNNNLKWLLIALFTTFSTTGYIVVAGMYVISYMKKASLSSYLTGVLFLLFFLFASINLSFLGNKLSNRLDLNTQLEYINDNESWYESEERTLAVERIPSLYFEFKNFLHDPWIGYGKDRNNSYFSKMYTSYYSTTGGFIQMFSVYGIILGTFFYLLLYNSSKRIAKELHSDNRYILFMCIILSLISYPLFEFAIFSAIWFYDIFSPKLSSNKKNTLLWIKLTCKE